MTFLGGMLHFCQMFVLSVEEEATCNIKNSYLKTESLILLPDRRDHYDFMLTFVYKEISGLVTHSSIYRKGEIVKYSGNCNPGRESIGKNQGINHTNRDIQMIPATFLHYICCQHFWKRQV